MLMILLSSVFCLLSSLSSVSRLEDPTIRLFDYSIMAASSSSPDDPILDTYHAVVLAFSDFLTVSIHTILYERDIYPQTSFLKARKYNYPVRQSRHPKVCQWIQDAVAAVEVEMLKVKNTTVSRHFEALPVLLIDGWSCCVGTLISL